jgi:hypothetical protein
MVRQLQFTKTALQAPRRGVLGDNLSFVDCALVHKPSNLKMNGINTVTSLGLTCSVFPVDA